MVAKDYRNAAREKLAGKWNFMALITLIESLIVGALSFTFVGSLLIAGPLTLGIVGCTLALVRQQDFKLENMFDGFGNFVTAFVLYLVNSLLIFLWSLLFVIPGIMKTYSYAMSMFILKDNPNMSASEARKASIEMMNGHRWQLFCLHFSFIGWYLLSCLTFGILLFWVIPYVNAATAEFYENLKGPKVEAKPAEKKEEPAEIQA